MTKDELVFYFLYLDAIRRSGVTNMFGAAPYLVKEFKIPASRARKALRMWMETYTVDESADVRAARAATGV